ncbi:MAG: YraN family protein [Prevotellaceae bacterium]|nr:YraN family protein [Prevotellaceae bacterium]
MAWHNDLGKAGEQQAADYLVRQGYTILDRNWRAPHSRNELDIVATKDECLVVVEVKTRSNTAYGLPFDAVDKRKISSLASAANSYVCLKEIDLPVRFDIIGILDGIVQHVENAFVPPAKYY